MRAISSASRSVESDVCSDGFSTTVLPATSGAPIFIVAKRIGWLNGTIRPTTPNGSRSV